MPEFATDELVAVAWLKTVHGINYTKVATKLPADASQWADTGFVTVTAVGGNGAIDLPLYGPVIRCDCWAANLNSSKAPWGCAGAMAQAIQYSASLPQSLASVTPGPAFHPVRVLSVYPVGVPTRVPSDEAGFARVYLDVRLHWTVTPDV